MKNLIKRNAILLILMVFFVFLFAFSSNAQTDYSYARTVRVGLAYGSGQVVAANAFADYGYEIGYFDENNAFVVVGVIDNRFVTFAKDNIVYVSGSTVSDVMSGNATKIGAYHLQVNDAYSSFDSAKSAAVQFQKVFSDNGLNVTVFPACINGNFYVRVDHFSTADYATASKAQFSSILGYDLTVVGASNRGITVIDMNNAYLVAEIEFDNFWPAARPVQGNSGTTYIKNSTYYYAGAFEYKRLSGDNITFINVVGLDDYVMGVVPYEMSSSFPLEALKAQSVCARSYYLGNYNKHEKLGFNVCNTTDCQVYRGVGSVNDRVREAVLSTSCQILTYEGKLVTTFFSASNGGYSENNSNVWGGTQQPYYTAVPDTYEELSVSNYGLWTSTASLEQLTTEIQKKHSIGKIVYAYVSERTVPANNVYAVTFVDESGKSVTVSKNDTVRTTLISFLKSSRFDLFTKVNFNINGIKSDYMLENVYALDANGKKVINSNPLTFSVMTANGKVLGLDDYSYVFDGRGWGHSVGMSQLGAKGRANAGQDYKQILTYYFQGTEVTENLTLKED